MTLDELIKEPRWPSEMEGFPVQWNRGEGLVELCNDLFKRNDLHRYDIADVGVARGISSRIFQRFGQVIAVDKEFWPGVREMLESLPDPTPACFDGDSIDNAITFQLTGAEFDLCYLDTAHDEEWVTREIQAWMGCVKPGGWIGGHDHTVAFPGVQMAVMKVLGGPDRVYSDGSWIKRI